MSENRRCIFCEPHPPHLADSFIRVRLEGREPEDIDFCTRHMVDAMNRAKKGYPPGSAVSMGRFVYSESQAPGEVTLIV